MSWEPSEQDVKWLQGLMNKLKVGGFWVAPSYGVTFQKIGENELKIMQPLIVTPQTIGMVERTYKVAEAAGIKLEKVDKLIFVPHPPEPNSF